MGRYQENYRSLGQSLKLTSVAIAVEGKMGLEVKITHFENAIQ